MSTLSEKRCKRCREVKPVDGFHRRSSARDGRQGVCKVCNITSASAWAKNNPHRDDYLLGYFHGLTLGQYDSLLAFQRGKCAGCGTDTPGGQGRFHIDHDHDHCPPRLNSSGRPVPSGCGWCVRGLVCFRCNVTNALVGLPYTNWILVTGGAR